MEKLPPTFADLREQQRPKVDIWGALCAGEPVYLSTPHGPARIRVTTVRAETLDLPVLDLPVVELPHKRWRWLGLRR